MRAFCLVVLLSALGLRIVAFALDGGAVAASPAAPAAPTAQSAPAPQH